MTNVWWLLCGQKSTGGVEVPVNLKRDEKKLNRDRQTNQEKEVIVCK
jgi:hypothetical protein